jgi:polysaccharide biosynthesis protein PelD
LRDALASLRDLVVKSASPKNTLPGVDALLNLLEKYVKIESAAIYAAEEKNGRVILGPMAGSLGEPQALDLDDALFQLAIEERKLVHIAQQEVSYERQSRQLIVVPLIASDDSLVGVLTVSSMPFFSLNVENLQMMSVMLAYYADHILNASDISVCQKVLPAMPGAYAEELARMLRMYKKAGISSQIVVMSFAGPARERIPAQLLRIKRGLDLYWQKDVDGNPVIAVLMPFASPSGLGGFLHRINEWLKIQFDGDFDSLQINLRRIDFAREDPLKALSEVMGS